MAAKAIRWTREQIDAYVKRRTAGVYRINIPQGTKEIIVAPFAGSGGGAGGSRQISKPSVPGTRLYPLIVLCEAHGLPIPKAEYPFAEPVRGWRADYCWPQHRLILEVDGGLFVGGRHSRGAGRLKDMEKLSEAAILGYRVIYCVPDELHNGKVIDRVRRALAWHP